MGSRAGQHWAPAAPVGAWSWSRAWGGSAQGGCSQQQCGDGGAIAQNPPAALCKERDEGIHTQTWPRSHWEMPTDAFHHRLRAFLFLHRYHRSTACPLPDHVSHTDKKSLVLTLSRPQPALLHWELATSHVSPGAAPQKITSPEGPQILELGCYRTNPGGIRAGQQGASCPRRP